MITADWLLCNDYCIAWVLDYHDYCPILVTWVLGTHSVHISRLVQSLDFHHHQSTTHKFGPSVKMSAPFWKYILHCILYIAYILYSTSTVYILCIATSPPAELISNKMRNTKTATFAYEHVMHAIIYVTASQVGIQFTNTGGFVLQCSLLIFHERQ